MFWRVLRQMITNGRGRLAVALVALVSGATASAALLNLEFDAERKFSHELRALGPNVLVRSAVAPGGSDDPGTVFDADAASGLLSAAPGGRVTALAPSLYAIVRSPGAETNLVLAGTWLDAYPKLAPWWSVNGAWVTDRNDAKACLVGQQAAARLHVRPGSPLEVRYGPRTATLEVAGIVSTGAAEDDQVFTNLAVAQQLAGLPGKVSLVQMSVAGTPEEVERYAVQLGPRLPGLEVRPLRQIAQAEGQLLARVQDLLFWSVGLILILTSLCVLATTLALAIERRADVGLMKALGGQMTRIVRLFLVEAGLLGAVGGMTGAVIGTLLSAWIGRQVFGTATSLRMEVIPLILAVMVAVALVGALPLRLLSHVRPGIVLRESK